MWRHYSFFAVCRARWASEETHDHEPLGCSRPPTYSAAFVGEPNGDPSRAAFLEKL